jgi:hypothetical protein
MPAWPQGPCSFAGTAAEVEVHGTGEAVLVEAEPFSHGKVVLSPAQIGDSPRTVRLDHPRDLKPVGMNEPEQPFDVIYRFGSPLTVEIARGGKDGGFRGVLAEAPGCEARWCDVAWFAGAGPKRLELAYDGPLPAELVGKQPIGKAVLREVVLRGAHGTLGCRDAKREVNGMLVFHGGALSFDGLRVEAAGLGLRVDDDAPPVVERFRVTVALGVVVLVAAALVAFRWLRRSKPAAAVPAPATLPPRRGSKLSGAEIDELCSALLSAYPTRKALAYMVKVGVDRNLDEIAGEGNLRDTVFQLVQAAEAQGFAAELFAAALARAPGNPALQAIAEKRAQLGSAR